jgi:hypothetical protein
MTAFMRAVPEARGPRVLRVGLVRAGHVLEDRLFTGRAPITIGATEAATFAHPALGAAGPMTLFERTGDAYTLHVVRGMRGRVALDDEIVDLATDPRSRLVLSSQARGRVTLGDATLLFQLVPPPAHARRPQLPLSIKGGLASQIDWNLTIIAAFSFLVHFGVIGSMYSDWMDPVVSTGMTTGGIIDMARSLPTAPVEVPTDGPTSEATPANAPAAKETELAKAPPKATTKKPMTAADAASLAKEAEDSIGISMFSVLDSKSSAVAAVLTSSEIPIVDLGDPASSARGARQATGSDLRFGSRGDALGAGSTHADLRSLAVVHGDPNAGHAGRETNKGGPSFAAETGVPTTPTGSGDDIGAPRVVAGLRGGFRACYNRGLDTNPSMSGKVTLIARVGPNGEVASTDSADNVGLSGAVVSCLLKKLATAQFDPGHGTTSVRVPAGFLLQPK